LGGAVASFVAIDIKKALGKVDRLITYE